MELIKVYDRMPVFIQNSLCSAYGYHLQKQRRSIEFYEYLTKALERKLWPYEKKCEFRDRQLQVLVKYALSTPFYRKVFREYGLNENSIRSLDDLSKLPIITKEIVKEHFDEFICENVPAKYRVKLHTSGSTGSGFVFYTTQSAFLRQWANGMRGHISIGISLDDWCGYFGGRPIVPSRVNKPPFYRYNYPGKQVLFSAYHMRPEYLSDYVEGIQKKQLKWLHGYPSSLSILAEFILENNIKLGSIEHITTCSENLHLYQKKMIEQAFGTHPYQNYAQTEGVAVFMEHEQDVLTIDEDFAAVEFVKDEDGNSHVVGTNLWNYAMPFLRYDTRDLAECIETPTARVITQLDGREEDVVILADGSKVGRLDHLFKDMKSVTAAQIIQKEIGKVEIHIVKGPEYRKEDEKKLQDDVHKRFGNRLNVKLVYKEVISKGKNGKQRFVISEIKR